MIQLYYWRMHLPSASTHIDTFNGANVPNLEHLPFAAAERDCKAAVARWNRQGGDTWLYQYIGIRNEEVARFEKEHA